MIQARLAASENSRTHITWSTTTAPQTRPTSVDPGGVTPQGDNTDALRSLVPGLTPDLRNSENRVTAAILVKF